MKRTVKLFIIPKGRIPKGPPDPPREFTVEAECFDRLFDAARNHIEEKG
ncbi:MAG: hypothetical protein JXA30_07115 [Deltaproteobacteria bacterium]|nr:hypothetical protein [Deltaproteobacteria bacterium]